ncbi:MAG: RluA family pseudouridine synthase [Phycisphaerales bacterium JB039]
MNLSVEPNERLTYGVAYEDDVLVVVEKPARRATQPGKGHATDTLLNALFARYGAQLQNLGAARDFGLLHRLDREASGLLVVALTAAAYDALRAQFEERTVGKFYWAVTRRAPAKPEGVINRPIAEVTGRMKTAKISPTGKPSVTAYRTLEASDSAALLECRPATGRLHQIRVHLASIGCAILGDTIYAPAAARGVAPRLALHAHRLTFAHPLTGAPVDARCGWPRDLGPLLKRMNLHKPE